MPFGMMPFGPGAPFAAPMAGVAVPKGKAKALAAFPPAPPLGGAGAGVPGVFVGVAGVVEAGKPPAELWLDSSLTPGVIQYGLAAGDLIEVVTKDPTTQVISGTCIFEVAVAHPPDAIGRFLEVKARGASVPFLAAQLEQTFPRAGGGYGVVHFCGGGMAACAGSAPGRHVFHVDQIRRRERASISEPWCKLDAEKPEKATKTADKVADLKEKLLKQKVASGNASAEEQVAYNLAKALKRTAEKAKSDDEEEPKKKKRKKKKKRHDSSDSSEETLFGGPLSLDGTGNPLLKCAAETPGTLYRQASIAAAQQTGARGRGSEAAAEYASTGEQWLQYLRTVLAPQYPAGIPSELMREMNTLATSLQHLAKGEVSKLGDVLVQRFKSLELGLSGNQAAAAVVQLVEMHSGGLTDYKELEQAQRYQKSQLKLAENQRALTI